MKCDNISTTNLDILYGFVNRDDGRNDFPTQLHKILSRVIIRFDMSELTTFEIIALKYKCRVEAVEDCRCTEMSDKDYVEQFDLVRDIDPAYFSKLWHSYRDACVYHYHRNPKIIHNQKDYMYELDNIGLPKYKCVAIFKGADILNLFGYQVQKIFNVSSEHEGSFEMAIENNLISGILNLISKGVYDFFTNKDIVTDAWLNHHIYNKFNNPYTLLRMFDSNGNNIEFIDTSQDDIIKKIKESYSSNMDLKWNEWNIEICCNTPVYMYFYYMLFCNDILQINDHSDYSLVFNYSSDISKDFFGGLVSDKIIQFRQEYDDFFNRLIKNESMSMIQKFYLCPRWRAIKYSMIIRVTCSEDIDRVIRKLYTLSNSSIVMPVNEKELIDRLFVLRRLMQDYKIFI